MGDACVWGLRGAKKTGKVAQMFFELYTSAVALIMAYLMICDMMVMDTQPEHVEKSTKSIPPTNHPPSRCFSK